MTDYRKAAQSLLDGDLPDTSDTDTLISAAAHALLAVHDLLDDRLPPALARDHLHRLLAAGSAAERRDEPEDVTEEPPVGSQVTDEDGDVWEHCDDDDYPWMLVAHMGVSGKYFGGSYWSVVRESAPLRLTTDADRERVGLSESSVNSSEGSVNEGECSVDTAPDVDLDEALREAVVSLTRRLHEADARRKQAEAEVERLTRERDRANVDAANDRKALTEAIQRYDALRADVERDSASAKRHHDDVQEGRVGSSPLAHADCAGQASRRLERILVRDDERGQQ